jgi:hypothetical protein
MPQFFRFWLSATVKARFTIFDIPAAAAGQHGDVHKRTLSALWKTHEKRILSGKPEEIPAAGKGGIRKREAAVRIS